MSKTAEELQAELAALKPQQTARPQQSPRARLQNMFAYHPPFGDQAERYSQVRNILLEAAVACCERTPESAEQTLAIRAMHAAMMHFNSAIAINEGGGK